MQRITMDSRAILVIATLSLLLRCENVAGANEGSSSEPGQQQTEREFQRIVVAMAFASLAGRELTGSTVEEGEQRGSRAAKHVPRAQKVPGTSSEANGCGIQL
jgi:hypothetical protein